MQNGFHVFQKISKNNEVIKNEGYWFFIWGRVELKGNQ